MIEREPGPAAAILPALMSVIVLMPLGLRAVDAWHPTRAAVPSYLPALEGPRERGRFNADPIADLARLNPGYVIIGDSMAGTRIDVPRLTELAGRPIAPLLSAGSGSAYWYFVLKNWVVASRIRPRCVFIFFRDTNLTNVMFRLDDRYRWMLDSVALEREDELNEVIASRTSGPWYRLSAEIERLYGADRARAWLEPAVTDWVGRVLAPGRRRRADLLSGVNARFGLDHLRPIETADIQATDDREADFGGLVDRSVLPLMLRDAKTAGLTLCFVRVQRRPIGGRPPEQSPALSRYVTQLQRYIESHGALWRDDTGDPALTLDMYEDGDHLAASARRHYTEIFVERLRPLFD